MAGRQTLGIVKPDAVQKGNLGNIVAHLERAGFVVRAAKLVRLSRGQAEAFYEVHRGRPFYDELVAFMTSGPCFPMALEKENAVAAFRTAIGRGRRRHDPETLRRIKGPKRRPRVGQRRQRHSRNRLLLHRGRADRTLGITDPIACPKPISRLALRAMLRVDVRELRRGPVETVGALSPTDPLLEGLDISLVEPLQVSGVLETTGRGDFVWKGRFDGLTNVTCRRCLREFVQPVEASVDALFSADPELQDDPSVYPLAEPVTHVDVTGAVREELALTAPAYVLCREDCRGLCPRCGADLNQGPCTCTGSSQH
jgi:nucleoside diphosphate kinase/uncharacterized metal-binding protein YceD (DUF177 family)